VWGRKSPEIDYLVIGAGVVGLSTAYYIKKSSPKSRVVVVDKIQVRVWGILLDLLLCLEFSSALESM
jgi:2-polyprenyl-6-methoxyphenol hydroxylase-like FAD-dependent oxidoreductase